MNVEHLREFVALARTRNFTQTARELSLAQSTLSKHMAALESELGFSLLDRAGGVVALTEPGKAILESTIFALEALDKGVLRARLLARSGSLPVRIGGYLQISSITSWIYRTETIARASEPSLRVSLYAPHTTDYMPDSARDGALDLLARNVVDLAVIEGPVAFPELEGFGHAHVFDEPVVFFAPSTSSLASRDVVRMDDLRGRHFVGSLNYPQFQDRIRELCCAYGFAPEFGIKMADTFNEFMRSDDPDEVYFLSASGAARVPEPPFSPLVRLAMDEPDAYSPVYLAWNEPVARPEVQAFVDAARPGAAVI